jgi:hypothetical protein
MARRNPLRELSRRFPPPPETKEILLSLHRQNDRSAAIVGTAILEAVLERLIIKKLDGLSPDLEGRLFKNRGPISDFDSKVLIATGLGLVTEAGRKRLDAIRAIRNVFAHSSTDVTFDTPEIENEIRASLMATALKIIEIGTEASADEITNKHAFVVILRITCWALDQQLRDMSGDPLIDLF